MGRSIDEAMESSPRTPSRDSAVLGPRGSIFVFEATGVTPKTKRQKIALVKMKLKEPSEDLQQREVCFLT